MEPNTNVVKPSEILEGLARRELLSALDIICRSRSVTREEVCGRGRTKNVSLARHELWTHLRRDPGMSYEEIGRLFDRDRTTIMAGVRAYARAKAAWEPT